jgi:hypothetical protein
MPLDDDDIRQVRSQEERRGKRPIDIAAQKRKQALLRKFRESIAEQGMRIRFGRRYLANSGNCPGRPSTSLR